MDNKIQLMEKEHQKEMDELREQIRRSSWLVVKIIIFKNDLYKQISTNKWNINK